MTTTTRQLFGAIFFVQLQEAGVNIRVSSRSRPNPVDCTDNLVPHQVFQFMYCTNPYTPSYSTSSDVPSFPRPLIVLQPVRTQLHDLPRRRRDLPRLYPIHRPRIQRRSR